MLTGKEAGCVPVSTRDGKYRSGMQGFFAEKSIYLQGHRVISVSNSVGTTALLPDGVAVASVPCSCRTGRPDVNLPHYLKL